MLREVGWLSAQPWRQASGNWGYRSSPRRRCASRWTVPWQRCALGPRPGLPSAGGSGQRDHKSKQPIEARRDAGALHFSHLPRRLVPAAMDASRRIRLDRRLVFTGEVILEFSQGMIRYEPWHTSPRARFGLFWYSERVAGALHIDSGTDPLPCAISGRSHPQLRGMSWALALVGLAELICRPAASRSDPWQDLRKHTAARAGALVDGHVRLLPDGREHSAAAVAEAARSGVRLRSGETFVRNHLRAGAVPAAYTRVLACPAPMRRLLSVAEAALDSSATGHSDPY